MKIDIVKLLIAEIEPFEKEGFYFLQRWTQTFPVTPDRVKTPSGRIIDMEDSREAGRTPRARRKEFSRAIEYYELVTSLPLEERNRYESFYDEGDEELCKIKYPHIM